MNKNNTVAAELIMKELDAKEEIVVPIADGKEVCMLVKYAIPVADAMELIGNIVDTCVDSTELEYTPEGYGTIIRREVLMKYANIQMPESIEDVYKLVWETDLYDRVCEHINMQQLNDLIDAANMKISYERNMLISTAAKKAAEVMDEMNRMLEGINAAFAGLDTTEMGTLMKKLSEMESINTAGVVKAIVEEKKPKRKTVRKKTKVEEPKADDAVDG